MAVIIPPDIIQIVGHLSGADAGVVRHQEGVRTQLLSYVHQAGIIIAKAAIEKEQIDGAHDPSDFLSRIAYVLGDEMVQAGPLEILSRLRRPVGFQLERNEPPSAQLPKRIGDPKP